MPTQITRLVVLMLENRSFDHVLGFIKRTNPAVNGLNGDEWSYPVEDNAPNVLVSDDAGDVEDLNPDPNYEFAHVTKQISSTGDPGVPGKFCTSGDETNWYERSLGWHEGRSRLQSRS
jgi:phospholipase C